MGIHLNGNPITVLVGDCLEQLALLEDESVQCCVTSPPYWGLRDYGTAAWEGGDAACDHQVPIVATEMERNEDGDAFRNSSRYRDHKSDAHYDRSCGKCGARRIDSQLGLEPTPEAYVAKMVQVFREVRRVLRKDGTLWCNMGDSYAGSPGGSGGWDGNNKNPDGTLRTSRTACERWPNKTPGLKPKDLCGIPWRVAFALQADGAASPEHMRTIERMITAITTSYDSRDEWPSRIRSEVESLEREWIDAHRGGWWLRSDIIWAKPNPMPESCTDRPTKSHEYMFLLTKSASYFYDAEAIKEQSSDPEGSARRYETAFGGIKAETLKASGFGNTKVCGPSDFNGNRNKRSVWTVATAPYPEAHFATYPPDLIKPCIMAGTSAKGCCAKCGAPWERVVEAVRKHGLSDIAFPKSDGADSTFRLHRRLKAARDAGEPHDNALGGSKTLGWQPTCDCGVMFYQHQVAPVPCTVLDPFAGSGTTGAVALELGRKAVLIELNPAYAEFIEQRTTTTMGLALA